MFENTNLEKKRAYRKEWGKQNRARLTEQQRGYVICHRDAINERKRTAYRKYPNRYLNNHLKFLYGITISDYNILLKVQDGKCAICRKPPKNGFRLGVDHDHKGMKARGLLCSKCNSAIGLLEDNPKLIRMALEYLEKW